MPRQYADERKRYRGHNHERYDERPKPPDNHHVYQHENGGKSYSHVPEHFVCYLPLPVPFHRINIFERGLVLPFLLPRVGAFSVHREGTDRAAIQTAVSVLEEGDRPLVMFPEGHITRTNDRLNPLQDGVALIARTAARRRAKREPAGRVVVHPVALRYRIRGSADGVVDRLLRGIERRLAREPRSGSPALDRILDIGTALLALKEIEILGAAREGELSTRLASLVDALLAPLEEEWCGGPRPGPVYGRVKRLRTLILAGMIEGEVDEPERARRWKQLADIHLALQFAHYPGGYLGGNPSPERILETVEKLEEDMTDRVGRNADLVATVTVGEPLPVRPERGDRGGEDPLLTVVEGRIRSMLGIGGP